MGKKSVRENKNIYHISRENAGYSRAAASELMQFVSEDRIERIENERAVPHPEDVLAMADCYHDPHLCNYFCSHECPIGKEYVPEIKAKALSQITLEMLATLNHLDRQKDRLIEITADGKIGGDELADFTGIHEEMEKLSLAIEAMDLWIKNRVAAGKLKFSE